MNLYSMQSRTTAIFTKLWHFILQPWRHSPRMHFLELVGLCNAAWQNLQPVQFHRGRGAKHAADLFVCLSLLSHCFSAAAIPLQYCDSLWQRSFFFTSTKRRWTIIRGWRRWRLFSLCDSKKTRAADAVFGCKSPTSPALAGSWASSGLEIFLYILPSLCCWKELHCVTRAPRSWWCFRPSSRRANKFHCAETTILVAHPNQSCSLCRRAIQSVTLNLVEVRRKTCH